MASKLTMTAATVTRQKYEIPYARVGIFDVDKGYKDSMSVDKFTSMYDENGSTIIITGPWKDSNDNERPAKTAKLVMNGSGNSITIKEGEVERIYDNLSQESLMNFYNAAKATLNGRDSYDNISMKDA